MKQHCYAICTATKLTIEKESCYVLPIMSPLYQIEVKPHEIQPLCYTHTPFTYPIEIEYDGYGSYTKVNSNINTKAIEKYFEVSIEDFLDGLLSSETQYYNFHCKSYIDNTETIRELPVTMCFINKEFYDECININTRGNRISTLEESIYLTSYTLEILGFKLIDTNKNGYDLLYQLEDLPQFEIMSNGVLNDKHFIFVSQLIEYLKTKYNYVLNTSILHNYTEHSLNYDRIIHNLSGVNKNEIEWYDYPFGCRYTSFSPNKHIYRDLFFNGKDSIKEHFVKWYHFENFANGNNLQLNPYHVCERETLILNNIKKHEMILSILKNKKK